MKTTSNRVLDPEMVTSMRRAFRERRIAALREGRRARAVTFTPKKGKGSYKRRAKHQEKLHPERHW